MQRAPKPDTKRHSFGASSFGSSFLPAFCLQHCFPSLSRQNRFGLTPRTCCLLQAPELSTFSLHSPAFGCTEGFRQIPLLTEVLTPLCDIRWVTSFLSALTPAWDPPRAFWGCPQRRYSLSDLSSACVWCPGAGTLLGWQKCCQVDCWLGEVTLRGECFSQTNLSKCS